MKKRPIFKDPHLQEQFDHDGYTKLKLFEAGEVNDLIHLFDKYIPSDINAFFSSSYLTDFKEKQEMSSRITEIIQENVAEHFINYRLIGAAFLVKGIGPNSEMPMHQDWTIVDESQFYAVNVWIPLTETNESNGTIEVLKGSHIWNEALRAPSLPFYFEGYEDKIKPKLTVINAELGEVVILNQAVIHYSKPNLSDKLRPAITCGLISKEAPLKFHYWDENIPGKIEIFDQDDDFLLRFENFHESIYRRPVIGKSTGYIDYEIPRMDKKALIELIGVDKNMIKKHTFLSRLFSRS